MTREQALELLRDRLQVDHALTGSERLDDLDWESIKAISFLSMADECFGVVVRSDQLVRCATVGDLLALLGDFAAGAWSGVAGAQVAVADPAPAALER